ncbi:O-antigen ligase family protein [Listeria rocourtiae]|uniref:O-antigen ligase family protein n=1 Tax=Listeria rocourtiae TaxID=647910 RepID=UPI001629C6D6|nr:O-antigen ligase family protein [Listeria rocourtiae]MBC1435190.1 O-antigen ligase family protein [Listeria rocourtiae]
MNKAVTLKIIFILSFLALLAAGTLYKEALVLPFFIVIIVFSFFFTLKQLAEMTWIILVIASFFGSLLSVPGYESLFLYRILLPVQAILLLLTWKDWSWLNRRVRVLLLLLIGWLVVGAITLIWAKYQAAGFRNLYYIIEAIYLIGTGIYYLDSKKKLERLALLISGVIIVNIGVGIYEITTGLHLKKSALVGAIGNVQFLPSGTFFNPNDLASFLVLFLPFVLVCMRSDTLFGKMIKIVLAVISVYIIVATQSRIALVLIVGILFLLVWKKSWKWGVMVLLSIPLVLQLPIMQDITEQVNQTYTQKDTSTDLRLEITNYTWQTIQDTHFIGLGPGNVQMELARYFPSDEQNGEGGVSVHNFLLEVLANYGLLSALCLFLFLYFVWQNSYQLWSKNKAKESWYMLPLIISIAFPFISFASSTTLEKSYVWISFGIILAILNHYFKRTESKNEKNLTSYKQSISN